MSKLKKIFIGLGALALISLVIGFAVVNASAKARASEQIHQQAIKSAADAELKIKKEKEDAVAKAIAEAKIKAEADLNAVREEDARIAKINETKAVQNAIASQKKTTSSSSAPVTSTSSMPMPSAPVTSGTVESDIDGTFKGWTGDTIFKLRNGQIWQQSSYAYMYQYAYSPSVTIYQSSNGDYKMKVDGVNETINVKRIK